MTNSRYIAACPLGCASELMDTEVILPEGCLKRCMTCGQMFSQCDTERFDSSMAEFNDPKGTWPGEKEVARLDRKTERLLERIEKFTGRQRGQLRLLDVGCSSGAFVDSAARAGIATEGVEPAEDAAKAAQAAGLQVHQGFLADLELPAESYDVITLFEENEHLKEPAPLLRECHRLLKPGGIMVMRTANTDSWTVRVMKGRWHYFNIDKHGGHISFFTPSSIARLAQQVGFRVKKIYTHSVSFREKEQGSYLAYRLLKMCSELLNLPARLLGRGHEMEIFLEK